MSLGRIVLVLLAVVLPAKFWAAKNAPAAPIPPQITSAKKVFISNAGSDLRFQQFSPTRAYDQLYAAIREWGHFEVVSSPADADLVFQISLATSFDEYGQKYEAVPQLHLAIVDPKTHILLWAVAEPLEAGKFYIVGGHQDAKFDKAMDRLVKDVKELVGDVAAGPPKP